MTTRSADYLWSVAVVPRCVAEQSRLATNGGNAVSGYGRAWGAGWVPSVLAVLVALSSAIGLAVATS